MLKSNCCNAKVKVEGNVTMFYRCCKCHQPCDVHSVIRKTWTRNPSVQILKDKRRKHWDKLNKKEINHYRKGEEL
jgi:hypothetical protein